MATIVVEPANPWNPLRLCTPAFVNVILTLIAFVGFAAMGQWGSAFTALLIMALITWLMQYLCSIGQETWSWIVLIVPIVVFLIFLIHWMVSISRSGGSNGSANGHSKANGTANADSSCKAKKVCTTFY